MLRNHTSIRKGKEKPKKLWEKEKTTRVCYVGGQGNMTCEREGLKYEKNGRGRERVGRDRD